MNRQTTTRQNDNEQPLKEVLNQRLSVRLLRTILSAPFVIAVLLRVSLYLWNFESVLGPRKELVTPVTDFKRVTEGLYLLSLNISPYAGDAYHQQPLVLAFFKLLSSDVAIRLVYITLDILGAFMLKEITIIYQKMHSDWLKKKLDDSKTKKQVDMLVTRYTTIILNNLPTIVASLYLFNPFTVGTCIAKSTISFNNFFVIMAIHQALRGHTSLSMLALALSSYLTLYPVILLPPLSLLNQKRPLLYQSIVFSMYSAMLLCVSFLMMGDWEFLKETYGFILLVPDLSPNIGLFWYFFTEVFRHFRAFFLFAYQYHVFIYTIPMYIRLRPYPMLMFWVSVAIISAFKSYPAFGDIALQMAFIPFIFDDLKGSRFGFLLVITTIYCMILAPLFWNMWIYQGTGNANFYYAINLALTITQVLLITDAIALVLKDEYLWKKAARDQPTEQLPTATAAPRRRKCVIQ